MTEFGMVTRWGSNVFIGGQPRPRPKEAGPQRPQIFWGPIPTSKRFDLQRRSGKMIHVGKYSVFIGGQPQHRPKGRGLSVRQIVWDLLHASTQYEKQQRNFAW